MSKKMHPLVQKTELELQKLDKNSVITWGDRHCYKGSLLPISVEPKMRVRALSFMNDLILLLEANGHNLKLHCNRLQIEMYGQLTEFNLRQKFYRKRIKSSSGYLHNTFVKSEDLEFQIGYSYRKGWIDKKTIKIEDCLNIIYEHTEKKSKDLFEHFEHQKVKEKKVEVQRILDEDKARLIALEIQKTETLVQSATNYKKALEIRIYLKALEEKLILSQEKDENLLDYINWGYERANEIDPLV